MANEQKFAEQKHIIDSLFRFDHLTVTNNGYPLLQIDVVRGDLRNILKRIKREFNLNFIVYLKIDGVSHQNYYFAVYPDTKECFSYCFQYQMEMLEVDNKYGIDVIFWTRVIRNSKVSLYDIFLYYYPLLTDWKIMKEVIKCEIDWDPKVVECLPTETNIFYKIPDLISLMRGKYKSE